MVLLPTSTLGSFLPEIHSPLNPGSPISPGGPSAPGAPGSPGCPCSPCGPGEKALTKGYYGDMIQSFAKLTIII